jgi:hypothetical protein
MMPQIPGIGDTMEQDNWLTLTCLNIMPANRLALARSLHEVVSHFQPMENLDFSIAICSSRDDISESVNIVLDVLTVSSGEAFKSTFYRSGIGVF